MKHCPNPECGGRAKFKTVSEFEDTATTCSDCGTALVPGEAPGLDDDRAKPDPNMQLVAVLSTRAETDLVIIESLLEAAGIPYLARGEQIQDLFGFGRLVKINPIVEPVEILVPEADAATAREVLVDFLA